MPFTFLIINRERREKQMIESIVPDYYRRFSCLAGKCPATCCAGWQIEIDEKSLIKYVKYQAGGKPFGNRLFNGIDWKDGTFCQSPDKRCDFLNEENLCDIYSEAGKKMLCRTCRSYPRHIEEFEGVKETSLALSCPEAARIILNNRKKVTFIRKQIDRPTETYSGFDQELYIQLREALFDT